VHSSDRKQPSLVREVPLPLGPSAKNTGGGIVASVIRTVLQGSHIASPAASQISASGELALEGGPVARPAVRREHMLDWQREPTR
jgi:hypothetical protein